MGIVGTTGRALIFIGALAGPVAAQDVALSAGQMLGLGTALLEEGRIPEAAQIATALLARNAQDAGALILQARVALQTGHFEAARRVAAQAYGATNDSDAKYVAARIAARAHAEDEQDTRAQLWLRRARQHAPNDALAAGVAEDFQVLRERNPLSVDLRFGLSPSDNINNGSVSKTTQLFGLPFEFELSGAARALSGVEVSAGTTLEYRLRQSATSITFADMNVDLRTYVLSNAAQKQAPDVKGSDFSDAGLSFGITHRAIMAEGMLPTTVAARVGQSWYAQEAYTQYADMRVAQSWRPTAVDTISASLSYRLTDYLDDRIGTDFDGTTSLTLGWAQRLPNDNQVRMAATYRVNNSEVLNRDYDAVILDVSYSHATPIAGVQFSVSGGVEERFYGFSTFAGGDSRTDDIISGSVSARFTGVEYFGFQPVVQLNASRAESTVDLYDRENLSLGFDLVSAF